MGGACATGQFDKASEPRALLMLAQHIGWDQIRARGYPVPEPTFRADKRTAAAHAGVDASRPLVPVGTGKVALEPMLATSFCSGVS